MLIALVEKYVAADHDISQRTALMLRILVAVIGGLFLAFGVRLLKRPIRFGDGIRSLLLVDSEMRERPLAEDLPWFAASAALGAALALLYVLRAWFPEASSVRALYREDGVFETLTAIVSAVSGGMFVVLAMQTRRMVPHDERRQRAIARIVLFLAAAACLLFALEEISWGQRIFGWETPAFLRGANYQGETNLHNLVFGLPQVLNWGLTAYCVLAVLSWVGRLRRRFVWVGMLFPHPCLLPLVFLGVFATGEIQEEIVVSLLLLHTFRVLLHVRRSAASSRAVSI